MTLPRLYHDLSDLWPILSPPSDYLIESKAIRRLLHERIRPCHRPHLLELGGGGGHGLSHLADGFRCAAVDLSYSMLENSRRLNPGNETYMGDMRAIRLDRIFDAVLLHDAIDYMLVESDVHKALSTARAHLNPGGMLLVGPTYTRESFVNHQVEHDQRHCGDLTLTYLSYIHDPDPSDSTFEMVLSIIHNSGGQVRLIEDRHRCGLFTLDRWRAMLDGSGFDAELVTDDLPWTLFVAIKRSNS